MSCWDPFCGKGYLVLCVEGGMIGKAFSIFYVVIECSRFLFHDAFVVCFRLSHCIV